MQQGSGVRSTVSTCGLQRYAVGLHKEPTCGKATACDLQQATMR